MNRLMKVAALAVVLALCMASVHSDIITDDTYCPNNVEPMRSFDPLQIQGSWVTQQYFAKLGQEPIDHCFMVGVTSNFTVQASGEGGMVVHVDNYENDVPIGSMNLTLSDENQLARWEHKDDPLKVNGRTYVLDTDYNDWMLMLHCTERVQVVPRVYMSSIIMSRTAEPLKPADLSKLKDKLVKFNVKMAMEHKFPVPEKNCEGGKAAP